MPIIISLYITTFPVTFYCLAEKGFMLPQGPLESHIQTEWVHSWEHGLHLNIIHPFHTMWHKTARN